MQSNKIVYVIAFIFLASGVGYLIFSGFQNNSLYFLHVSEALAKKLEKGDRARLFGQVQPKSISKNPEEIGVVFQLADKKNPSEMIKVKYNGAVPDTFEPGVEVIVEGVMHPSHSFFSAHKLMTKCPSKYKSKG